MGLSVGLTPVTRPSMLLVIQVDRDYILENTCRHGEYKYTADDYSTARIDNHKIMFLRSTTNTGMIRETLLLTAKLLGNFILRKLKIA